MIELGGIQSLFRGFVFVVFFLAHFMPQIQIPYLKIQLLKVERFFCISLFPYFSLIVYSEIIVPLNPLK